MPVDSLQVVLSFDDYHTNMFHCFNIQYENSNGSKHHCLLPLLIVTANTFLTMCMVRICALWWSRGELNPLFEHFTPFYCALLPAFWSVFRTFLSHLTPARDRF